MIQIVISQIADHVTACIPNSDFQALEMLMHNSQIMIPNNDFQAVEMLMHNSQFMIPNNDF